VAAPVVATELVRGQPDGFRRSVHARNSARIPAPCAGKGCTSTYERATLGGEYVQEVGIDGLLLVPTYIGRPWVSQGRRLSSLLVCYPVSEEAQAPWAEEARLRRILRLSRALSDESRLRTLRLASTPSTLQELADHFGLGKSTMHHHLAALKAAGLLRMRMADRRYALREQVVAELPGLLSEHLRAPEAADAVRLEATARRRPMRFRRGRVTIEIHLSPGLAPEQIDQVFASLARHLG